MTSQYKTNQYTGLPDRINDTELTGIDYIQFDTTHSETPVEGRVAWNSTDGTLDLGLIGGTVNLQIGQEVLVRAKNDQGSIINNGDVVYLSGADGNNPLIKLADADTVAGDAVLGLATEQIAINGQGYVTTFGKVRDLNTNAYNAGDVLYLSQTPGQLTTTPPTSPAKVVKIGTVLRKNINNGIVLVSVHVEPDLSGYLTSESDPVFSASAAASITAGDITKLSNLSGTNTGDQDLSGKQDLLVSGTNIKTVNGNSLLGSGNVSISSSTSWGSITGTLSSQTDLQTELNGKAATSHTHAAADITSGTIETARLGSGTANSSSYLRGDQTWATIAGGGDVTGPVASVDNEIALFSGTGGKTIKRATTTGLLKASSGVIAQAISGTDFMQPYTLVATLASDQATGANTNMNTLTGLVFSYAANSTYKIELLAIVQPTAATTGCGFAFDTSTAVTSNFLNFYHQLATSGTLSGGSSIADDTSLGVSSGMVGTSAYGVIGHGIIITGANTGTAQLRFRAEVAAVTTCKAGTTLLVQKIA